MIKKLYICIYTYEIQGQVLSRDGWNHQALIGGEGATIPSPSILTPLIPDPIIYPLNPFSLSPLISTICNDDEYECMYINMSYACIQTYIHPYPNEG